MAKEEKKGKAADEAITEEEAVVPQAAAKAGAAPDAKAGLTAEDLAKEFKEHSVAEFFKKNKQMIGFVGKIRTLTTIVHEYVTNSLDACEEARALPDIEVQLTELGNEFYEVTVKDNGPGLTQETVGKALGQLLAGTKFHRMMQMRGQQGIGASGCTMLSQTTTGKATKVITGSGKGKPIQAEIMVDPKKNEAKIMNLRELGREFKGTVIKAQFKDVKYINSEQSPVEYLRRTAIANPHARIKFIEPNGQVTIFERSLKYIPDRPLEVKPHPKGVTVDELLTLAKYTDARKVGSFLKNEFDRMGDKSVEEITKKGSFDMNKDPRKLTWEESEEIIKRFKEMDFIAPRTDGLRAIGEERIRKSLESIVQPEFISTVTRKPQVYSGGYAFQVEVAVAYGGNAGRMAVQEDGAEVRKMEVMRFANRAPLLFDGGASATTKAIESLDWKRYGIKDMENTPLTVFVNLLSVHIPYTSAGKQAIADEPEVVEEIRLALMESLRKTGRYIITKRKEAEKQLKREMFLKYIPEVATALSQITREDKKNLERNLEKLVLDKLKLEESMAAEKLKKDQDAIEAEIEGRTEVAEEERIEGGGGIKTRKARKPVGTKKTEEK